MQLRFLKNLHPPSDGMAKVTSISWSANACRLAAVGSDKIVQLFDENGDKQDRFSTKPADKGQRAYMVKTIEFSPDSTKLAIGQSDNIVFVYKLGTDWKDKKSICNKFAQTSSVTCLCWPTKHPNELVFGLAEGRVKVGQLKSNKAATLYQTDSFVVSLCAGPDGNSVISGHLDGSIFRFSFETETSGPISTKFASVPTCVPYALGWGYAGIIAAGTDSTVRFWDPEGRDSRTFDYSSDPGMKEFTVAAFNPSGESVVVGNFNRFLVYAWHAKQREWIEAAQKEVPNLYTVTALGWRADGSRLIIGSLCGGIDMFDACIRRSRYRGAYEFTYISLSQVIVKSLNSGARVVLKSNVGFEIKKINIFQERFLVAHTSESVLLGDLASCRLSEIPWHSTGKEKFFFDNPSVCMIFKAGELTLVEYGCNEILSCARTEHMSPHLISVRIGEGAVEEQDRPAEIKVIAYLLDAMTIRVSDLVTGQTVASVYHDTKIDWLELNPGRANRLLFRDKRRQLYLYDIEDQTRVTLLNYCNYVQWVPDSDVVVAQNRTQLCVWYSISAPDRVTLHEIKGDIEEIERSNGRTCVIVDEGQSMVEYELDEALISFGSCLERGQHAKAVYLLEELPLTLETEAMWRSLADVAMTNYNLPVAERCYAVLGDVAKSRFLHKCNRVAQERAEEVGGDGTRYYMVQAKIAMLEKQFQRAEAILLDHGELDEAMEMYQELHKYDEAIRLAERNGHPNVAQLKNHYLQWLLSTQQEEQAGELQEVAGDYVKAIELYLKGGMAAKAAKVVSRNNSNYSQDLLQKVVAALQASDMHDKAGELYERMGLIQPAMEAYRKGHAYRQAVDLAKQAQPALVVQLEEAWGDWLVSQKQVDAAINHYIEAGCSTKAIDAAMTARQWNKAEQLLESTSTEPDLAVPFYEKLAQHYASSRQFEQAERAFIKSQLPQKAVQMYVEYGQYEKSIKVAKTHISANDRTDLFVSLAQNLEVQGKLNDAETLYGIVNEFDLAINMYKKREEYEQMLRLVSKYRKELLNDTYKHIAEQYEMKGNLKKAEHYYVEAKMWTSAMGMYRQLEKWDDAKRVAKMHGGKAAFEKVVLAQAHETFKEHGSEAGAQLLAKHGLVEIAIDYAIEHSNFTHAFELANNCAKHKLPDIHLKKALQLEDEEKFQLAEAEFIKAGKAKEAIDMFVHQRDWVSAMRVAEAHDKDSIKDVMVHQAKDLADQNNLEGAESIFIQARKPELAVQMYSSKRMVNEAIRVCKKHCPHMLGDIVDSHGVAGSGPGASGGGQNIDETLDAAKIYEETGNYSRAIDTYLSVNDNHTSDPDRLEEAWENATRLAMKHTQDRYNEVVMIVANKLQQIQRFEAAAELYESIDKAHEAIHCYLQGECWNKAKVLAQQQAPDMVRAVEEKYKNHLMKEGDGDELIRRTGDISSALDMYARSGDWDKCLDLAEKQGPKMLPHYLIQNCKILATENQTLEACRRLVRYGPPKESQNFQLYKILTNELLSSDETDAPKMLREMLLRLLSMGNASAPPTPKKLMEDRDPTAMEFHRAGLVAHYQALRNTLKDRQGGMELCWKISCALCRYCTEFPVDRAFLQAGMDCKDAGNINMAFFFLNRYLDIADAIDDPDNAQIDGSDFMDTDIPSPYDLDLPETHYGSENQVEEIRDWVLGWSMDANVQQKMDSRPCDSCRTEIYAGTLTCPKCNHKHEPCVVTGYPVLKRNRVECTSCGVTANRDDWNAYLRFFKICPWCSIPQNAQY